MTVEDYQALRAAVIEAGFADEVEWCETVTAPVDAIGFAGQAVWVILCSGMKAQIARLIEAKVWPAIHAGRPVSSVFGHDGKSAAIETIWRDRAALFEAFLAAADKVEFCKTLPWIGDITKWHLAKNLGVDCAKPDIHLSRVAAFYGTTPAALCESLARSTGERVATVDYVIWRACNLGLVRTLTLAHRHANGAPMFALDGMMLDEHGNRSIFDDVDA